MLSNWNDVLHHIDNEFPVYHRFRFTAQDLTPERPHAVLRVIAALCWGTHRTKHKTFVLRVPLVKDYMVEVALCTALAGMQRRASRISDYQPNLQQGRYYLVDGTSIGQFIREEDGRLLIGYETRSKRGNREPLIRKISAEQKIRLQSCKKARHLSTYQQSDTIENAPIDWLMQTNLHGNRDPYRPEVILVGHITRSIEQFQRLRWVLTDGNIQLNEPVGVLQSIQVAKISGTGDLEFLSSGDYGASPVILLAASLHEVEEFLTRHDNLQPVIVIEDKVALRDTSSWNRLRDDDRRLVVLADSILDSQAGEWMQAQDLPVIELTKRIIGYILNAESTEKLPPNNGTNSVVRARYWNLIRENLNPIFLNETPLDAAFYAFTSIRRDDLEATGDGKDIERAFYSTLLPESRRLDATTPYDLEGSEHNFDELVATLHRTKQWFNDKEIDAIEIVESSIRQWFDEIKKCPTTKHAHIIRTIFHSPHPSVLVFRDKREAESAALELGSIYKGADRPDVQTSEQARAKLILINSNSTWNISNIDKLREQAYQSTTPASRGETRVPPSPRCDGAPVSIGDGVFCTEVVDDAANNRTWVYCATPQALATIGYVKSAVIVGWLGRQRTVGLIDGRIAEETTLLLYPFEKVWYQNSIGKTHSCVLRKVGAKTIDRILGYPSAHLLEPANTHEEAVDKNTHKLRDTEPDEHNQRQRQYKMELSRRAFANSPDEHVDAVYVEFADGSYLYAPYSREFTLAPTFAYTTEAHPYQTTVTHADDLVADDVIVLKDGSDSDIVRQMADHILIVQGKPNLRKLAGRWKEALRQYAGCHNRFGFWQGDRDRICQLHALLQNHNVQIGITTMQTWLLREQPIGPQDADHIKVIADITGDNFLATNLNEVMDAIDTVRSAHRSAGESITRNLVEKLEAEFCRIDIDNGSTFEIPGLGVLKLLRIAGVEKCSVPYTVLNKLNQSRSCTD